SPRWRRERRSIDCARTAHRTSSSWEAAARDSLRSHPIPTSISCCAPRQVPKRSKRCSPQSSMARRSRSRTRKCSSWLAASSLKRPAAAVSRSCPSPASTTRFINACLRAAQIDVLIHPQSVVHSMVELTDGSIIAQLGITDMRLPIQYAFSYPERWPAPLPSLDLARAGRLEFSAPDTGSFPCLRLAYRALQAERSLPVVLNAANEVAVARFLEGKIGFTAISQVIERTMDAHPPAEVTTLEQVRAVDSWARECSPEVA